MLRALCLLIPLGLVTFAGCNGGGAAKDKTYDVRGKITALDPAKPAVTLDHEDIPGLMKAMEMPFDVKDAKVLDGLQKGDAVQGKLQVKDGKYVVTELKKR